MRDYYFMVYPSKDEDDEDDDGNWHGQNKDIDFDKLTPQRRAAMRIDWASDSKQGEQV